MNCAPSAVYYNEIDPYCCDWLRNLISSGHLPAGYVDQRPIEQVDPDDLLAYSSCHFFAGIGGWPLALRLAGWPDTQPVWTGSCPCQPFSAAGKRGGQSDPRHLWPEFRRLIAVRNPPVVFGEQVASKDGKLWLCGVRTDLEDLDYAVGAADLCAAGVGAPHIRQRLYWVADHEEIRWRTGKLHNDEGEPDSSRSRPSGRLAESDGGLTGDRDIQRSGQYGLQPANGFAGVGLVHAALEQAWLPRRAWESRESIECLDGKFRVIEPGLKPLAHGVPARMGKLRAYGNAIVPQVAAEFIAAYLDSYLETL